MTRMTLRRASTSMVRTLLDLLLHDIGQHVADVVAGVHLDVQVDDRDPGFADLAHLAQGAGGPAVEQVAEHLSDVGHHLRVAGGADGEDSADTLAILSSEGRRYREFFHEGRCHFGRFCWWSGRRSWENLKSFI